METPWEVILVDGAERLASAIDAMVDRHRDGELLKSLTPAFSAEADRARWISSRCKWLCKIRMTDGSNWEV